MLAKEFLMTKQTFDLKSGLIYRLSDVIYIQCFIFLMSWEGKHGKFNNYAKKKLLVTIFPAG